MLPLSLTIFSQAQYLLRNLNESNSDIVFQELSQYIGCGVEESILVLQSCLDYLSVYGKDLGNMQLEPMVVSIFRCLFVKPNFCTIFCEALRCATVTVDFLENLCNALQLEASEKIELGLALSDSENPGISMCGKNFCMAQIKNLSSSHSSVDSTEQVQKILTFLQRPDSLSRHVDMLPIELLKEGNEFILAPLLSNELKEADILRSLNLFSESNRDDEFDVLQTEMEKEISLSDVIREMGYGCTVNVSCCKYILSLFSPLTERTVAKILGIIARTCADMDNNQYLFLPFCSALDSTNFSDLPPLETWNADVLVDSIKQLVPGINWINVIENLDHEGFYIPNEDAFCLFISIYRVACKDPFPLGAICGSVWSNATGQLSFLKYAVSAAPEVFTFAQSPRQLAYEDAMTGHKFQPGHANRAWLCLDLLEVLCKLAERSHVYSVRLMLEYPLKHCPELLLLGMAHINTAFNLLLYEVTSAVFALVLESPFGDGMALHLWRVNPTLLVRGFIYSYGMDPVHMIRVLELCQELMILSPVLDLLPSIFGIRLASLASKRELDLEKWLTVNLIAYKEIFFKECLKFLKEVQSGAPIALLNLFSETSPIFLKVLQAHMRLVSSSQLSEETKKLHQTFMDASSNTSTVSGIKASTGKGVEEEANSYFQKLFSDQLTIETMLQTLVRLNESSGKRDQAIFDCMIFNLFEEYKFFSKYPDKQLKIVASLYGLLIKFQLVTHTSLAIALRAVLDALCKPADSNMFLFGVKALEQFLDRMVEWPQYCNHVLQISHLRNSHSEIVSSIERSLTIISSGHSEPDVVGLDTSDQLFGAFLENLEMPGSSSYWTLQIEPQSAMLGTQVSCLSIQPQQRSSEERQKVSIKLPSNMNLVLTANVQPSVVPSADAASFQKSQSAVSASLTLVPSPGYTRPSPSTTSTKFGPAMNIETLVAVAEKRETPIQAPAQEIQDKISFIMNNLSVTNVEAKSKEFSEYLKEEYYPWFSQYLIMKRASIEHNHHEMYLKFLDKINSKTLNKEVVQSSYENCKVLLGSKLIKSSSEARSLLKNLGSWLGKITIGRNQVLRAREIDLKPLIIEAYEKGLMIAVIPFTSRILDACQTSAAYQPPNPWTMGVLGLLVEIHSMPNLKMNLKFEIEVLLKNLRVDMKDVTPTSLLKNRIREVQGNPDFSCNDLGSSQSQKVLKNLRVDNKDVTPTSLLKNRIREVQGSSDLGSSQSQKATEVQTTEVLSSANPVYQAERPPEVADSPHLSTQSQASSERSSTPVPRTLAEDAKPAALGLPTPPLSAQGLPQGKQPSSVRQLHASSSNIEQLLIVNPKLHALGLQVHFQSVLPVAVDRAVKEIVTSVVRRSVTIATKTTKELVLNEFLTESYETRIHKAARVMVASLAGSLAHVICKEHLHVSLSNQLARSLQGFHISGGLEQAVQLVTNDNLDSSCALIQQAAVDQALQTIDEEIEQQLSIRRKHWERVGPTIFDENFYTQGYMGGVLPKSLRPKPGQSSTSQLQVCEACTQTPIDISQRTRSYIGTRCIFSPASSSLHACKEDLHVLHSIHSGTSSQDFVRLPWKNQSIQISKAASSPAMVNGKTSETNSNSTKFNSSHSIHVGVADDSGSRNIEKDAIITSVPSSPAPELHLAKPSKVVKESGINKTSEPFLSTGNALDTNQTISEMVLNQTISEKAPGSVAASKEVNNTDSAEVSMLFTEWFHICDLPESNNEDCIQFALKLLKKGILKGDDPDMVSYFYILLEISVSHCLFSEVNNSTNQQELSFLAMDMYAELVVSILKFSHGDGESSKISIFSKVLLVTVRYIQADAEEKKQSFNPRPYFRLFINWIVDLPCLEPLSDGATFQVLVALTDAFHLLRPLQVPGFSYMWLELVSHRNFMPKLLGGNGQRGWPFFKRLLVDLFQFMEPYLWNTPLPDSVSLLYIGTLRVFLVLVHDFPEFVCDYHFSFCDVIPFTCIQMRNIILSAYPLHMRLPKPNHNPKMESRTEINQSPPVLTEVDTAIKTAQIKCDIDDYIKTRQQGSPFLYELKQKLMLDPSETTRCGTRYNVPLMNSLVLYLGMQAVEQLHSRSAPSSQHIVGGAVDVFKRLIIDLDTEGRYLFLNAIANQLRYPNNHTHYFSYILLLLFEESDKEVIKEQISRVILERILVHSPYPWGLLATFIELITNERYNFWSRSFVRCAPEIEKLSESVLRSYGGPKLGEMMLQMK